jgi:hypothetical protein
MFAPLSRACGRYATTVYSGRGADIVMQSSTSDGAPHAHANLRLNTIAPKLCSVRKETGFALSYLLSPQRAGG